MTQEKLTNQQLIAIDRICINFERRLNVEETVDIRTELSKTDRDLQSALFTELLFLQLTFRRNRKLPIERQQLLRDFPEYQKEIDSALTESDFSRSILAIRNGALEDSPEADSQTLPKRGFPVIPGLVIEKVLDRGGMGVVYLARDVALNRQVVVKMLASNSVEDDRLHRFRTEAQAISELHHVNIVKIYSVGEHFEQPFILLEYAPNGSLKDMLNAGPLDEETALTYILDIARTIKFVHERGYLHRDLKPSNILFDANGVLKISDFGLAKNLDDDAEVTHSQVQMGTPAYMAPEQLRSDGVKASVQSDIYSLGILMHAMLTGSHPYPELDTAGIFASLGSDEPVPDHILKNSKASKFWRAISLKCMQKQPHDRYQSAEELIDDLQRLQDAKSVSLWPLYKRALYDSRKSITVGGFIALLSISLLVLGNYGQANRFGFHGSVIIDQLDSEILEQLDSSPPVGQAFKVVTLLDRDSQPELSLLAPQGIAIYDDRYLAVSDTLNHRVLLLDLETGDISHLAGELRGIVLENAEFARQSTVLQPAGLDFDSAGNLFLAGRDSHAVYSIGADGLLVRASGTGRCEEPEELNTVNGLCFPNDVSVYDSNELLIADPYRQLIRFLPENGAPIDTGINTEIAGSESTASELSHAFTPSPTRITSTDDSILFYEQSSGSIQVMDYDRGMSELLGGLLAVTDLQADHAGSVYFSSRSDNPIARFDTATRQLQSLEIDQLTAATADSENPVHISAIALDTKNRIFFSDMGNNSVKVIVPSDASRPIPMNELDLESISLSLQENAAVETRPEMRFVDAPVKRVFTEIAFNMGLRPVLDASVTTPFGADMASSGLTGIEFLTWACSTHKMHCGIEMGSLLVAAPSRYPFLSDSPPIRFGDSSASFTNAELVPASIRGHLQQEVVLEEGTTGTLGGMLEKIEEQTDIDYLIDSSVSGFLNVTYSLNGNFTVNEIHGPFILLGLFEFTYLSETGQIQLKSKESE